MACPRPLAVSLGLREFALTLLRSKWLLALVALRLLFSALLPMTGDEGYFVFWGDHPAGGYYDHPPMVGWWLAGLLALGRAEWLLRLPATLLPLVLAYAGWLIARPYGRERARFAAWLVLLQPANVWNVLITTDTPVVLFSALSVLAYMAALRAPDAKRSKLLHAGAGALLGLAFLGKYFAALLGIAYLAHVLLLRRDRARWTDFALLLAAALPAPIYNLWWNSEHCWVNILFNFVNRQQGAGFALANPALYAASLAYLATPWLLWALWRERRSLAGGGEAGTLLALAAVPLTLFALMSFGRVVGLHWLLAFMFLLATAAAIALAPTTLERLVRWSAFFALVHVVVLSVVMALPTSLWQKTRYSEGIALRLQAPQLVAALSPYTAGHLLAMEGYSSASFLAYKIGRPVAVFGRGSVYAREDDFVTNWRAQDGRDIAILRTRAADMNNYLPFFAAVDLHEFAIDGAAYTLVIGKRFNYAVYHERVLEPVRERFYKIPGFLPRGACAFCERYFADPE